MILINYFELLIMKKQSILIYIFCISALLISSRAITNSTGAPSGRNGSPTSSNNCASIGCHNGPSISTETVSVSSDIPQNGFLENTDYTFTITADDGGRGLGTMGFQASVENASGHQGSLSSTGSETQKVGDFITHTSSGISASGGQKSWSFDWNSGTAPDSVRLYLSVNFANGNGTSSGDAILTTSEILRKDQTVTLGEYSDKEVIIYPNPTEDVLQVEGLDADVSMLRILDLSGRVVEQFPAAHHRKGDSWNLKIEHLPGGLYLLSDGEGQFAIHFRKN